MLEYDPLLLPERVNEFASYLLGVKGCSKLTVNGYVRDLRLLFEYLAATKKEHISPADIKKDYDLSFIDDSFLAKITIGDIYAFLAYCTSERDNNLTTKNRKASSIRGFFKYISDNMKYIPVNPVSHLQIPSDKKKLPRYLTLEQSEALLNAVEGENAARDYCILTLFLNCGLRLAELVGKCCWRKRSPRVRLCASRCVVPTICIICLAWRRLCCPSRLCLKVLTENRNATARIAVLLL